MARQHVSIPTSGYPEGAAGEKQVVARQRYGAFWAIVFMASTLIGVIALMALLYNVVNSAFGYVMIQNELDPEVLVQEYQQGEQLALSELPKKTLVAILEENVSAGLMRRLENDKPFVERSQREVYELVLERVVEAKIVKSWTLSESIFQRGVMESEVAATQCRVDLSQLANRRFYCLTSILETGVCRGAYCHLWVAVGDSGDHSVLAAYRCGRSHLLGGVCRQQSFQPAD
jgi:hypothetical protein